MHKIKLMVIQVKYQLNEHKVVSIEGDNLESCQANN